MTVEPDLFSAVPDAPPRLGRVCMICEAGNAPFGLGMPGFRSEIRPGERGMLWHCGGEACAAKAEGRRAAKLEGRR
ncbi:MAG: hypothetical protein ACE37J_13955 [Pikeienuella sp.]|uniref:hypothetical protein n=1 Tax=Pikeienuella sp. TaxID=2831957 RepID=UPI00391B9C6E